MRSKQFEKAREKKEATKKEELNKRAQDELTQEAAALRVKEAKRLEGNHKSVMKKVNNSVKNEGLAGGAVKTKSAICKKRKESGEPKRRTSTNRSSNAPKKRSPKEATSHGKVALQKKKPKPQGGRKVPVASDEHGCRHNGLLELKPLPKAYLEAYVKVGGWLYQMPCRDCAKMESGKISTQVLDVACLLNLKGRCDVAYYCNSGPTGHKMDDGLEWKPQWTCSMVLCMNCYNKRKIMMGEGNRRTRRKKVLE